MLAAGEVNCARQLRRMWAAHIRSAAPVVMEAVLRCHLVVVLRATLFSLRITFAVFVSDEQPVIGPSLCPFLALRLGERTRRGSVGSARPRNRQVRRPNSKTSARHVFRNPLHNNERRAAALEFAKFKFAARRL